MFALASGALQEVWPGTRPSRIATRELVARFHLPSPLSRYGDTTAAVTAVVRNKNNNDSSSSSSSRSTTKTRVHWIEYRHHHPPPKNSNNDNSNSSLSLSLDAIYLNHGFGASSLSWLPVVPALARQLLPASSSSCVLLAHDAPGFGFTDRSFDDHNSDNNDDDDRSKSSCLSVEDYYSLQHSAAIGVSLLQSRLGLVQTNKATTSSTTTAAAVAKDVEEEDDQPGGGGGGVLLVGHSMGCLTTLRMALQMGESTSMPLRILLVAPALGLTDNNGKAKSKKKKKKQRNRSPPWLWTKAVTKRSRAVGSGILAYALRRVVGIPQLLAHRFAPGGLCGRRAGPGLRRGALSVARHWPGVGTRIAALCAGAGGQPQKQPPQQ